MSLGWGLIQYAWCPYKRRRLGHTERDTWDAHVQREEHVRTQQEGGCLQAKERGLGRNQPCRHLDLRLLACRMVRK